MKSLMPSISQQDSSKLTMYRLDLSADLDLQKTRTTLKTERFKKNLLKFSNSRQKNANLKTNRIYNTRYSFEKSPHTPNLQLISNLLEVDQKIWQTRKECLSPSKKQLYNILSSRRNDKIKKQKQQRSKNNLQEYINNYEYFLTSRVHEKMNKNQKMGYLKSLVLAKGKNRFNNSSAFK